jgi:hypothetical protein
VAILAAMDNANLIRHLPHSKSPASGTAPFIDASFPVGLNRYLSHAQEY